MQTLRGRLILSHILPLLLVLPLIGLALIYVLETQVLVTDLADTLVEETALIGEALKVQPELWGDSDQAAQFVSGVNLIVEGQVLLLRPNGELWAASIGGPDAPPTQLPDLEELNKALSGNSSVQVTYGLFRQKVVAIVPVQDVQEGLQGFVSVSQTLEGIATTFERLRWWVLGTIAVELVLGGLIGLLLANRLAKPIDRVATAVIDIAEGKRIKPLPEKGPQEIRQLSGSVNILSEDLRILEETRHRSLSNIVHELGRPLGAVLSAIHVLRGETGEDPEIRQELLGGIEAEIERMKPLLDDLAQLHGQVTGQLVLSPQATPISDWLPPLLLPWRATAIEKGLEWEAVIPSDLPTLELDQDRIAQVIGNLLSNAIKYTPEGGRIAVSAGTDSVTVWIQVSDSGPGISPDEHQRVFEPFFRSQQERRFPQGLGLGLTIARDLVQAHGGEITLVSEPGQGSRFIIHLPLPTA